MTLPTVIEDRQQEQCFEEAPEDSEVDQMRIVYIGRDHVKPHLIVRICVSTGTGYPGADGADLFTAHNGGRHNGGL